MFRNELSLRSTGMGTVALAADLLYAWALGCSFTDEQVMYDYKKERGAIEISLAAYKELLHAAATRNAPSMAGTGGQPLPPMEFPLYQILKDMSDRHDFRIGSLLRA